MSCLQYPAIYGTAANGSALTLNATATIGSDRSSLVLTAAAPAGFKATSTSYGRVRVSVTASLLAALACER